MLSVRQIAQLDAFEVLMDKLGHLLEVYLDPHRFADTTGLDPEEAAAKIAEVQRTALRLLAPTEKDSLAGTVKAYADSLMRSIELKRAIAGFSKTSQLEEAPQQAEGGGRILEVENLSTDELRTVQRGMELLERHQNARHDLPKPPRPAIDDLLGPAPR